MGAGVAHAGPCRQVINRRGRDEHSGSAAQGVRHMCARQQVKAAAHAQTAMHKPPCTRNDLQSTMSHPGWTGAAPAPPRRCTTAAPPAAPHQGCLPPPPPRCRSPTPPPLTPPLTRAQAAELCGVGDIGVEASGRLIASPSSDWAVRRAGQLLCHKRPALRAIVSMTDLRLGCLASRRAACLLLAAATGRCRPAVLQQAQGEGERGVGGHPEGAKRRGATQAPPPSCIFPPGPPACTLRTSLPPSLPPHPPTFLLLPAVASISFSMAAAASAAAASRSHSPSLSSLLSLSLSTSRFPVPLPAFLAGACGG